MAAKSEKTGRPRSGRPGSTTKTRELTALIGALGERGDAIDLGVLSARLGIPAEEVRRRLQLIMAAGGDGSFLPLIEDDDGERLVLAYGGGNRGRNVRLTRDETVAVQAALNFLGIPVDNPLRETIDRALSSAPVDPDLVRRALGGMSSDGPEADNLAACSRALADLGLLEFEYRNVSESEWRRRRVDPRRLRISEGRWILDAFDLDKHAMRHFRVDRMAGPRQLPAGEGTGVEAPEEGVRTVRVTFRDRRLLTVLSWPGISVESDGGEGGEVTALLPYYGGSWLPRRLAACGGAVEVEDAELRAAVVELARNLLDELGDAGL